MKTRWMTRLSVIAIAVLLLPGNAPATAAGPTTPQGGSTIYLPMVIRRVYTCPATSTNSYYQNVIYRGEVPPIRPAEQHADKNFALRGYITITTEAKTLISDVADPAEPHQPPQLGTIFNPDRVTTAAVNITQVYHTYLWNWGVPPDPGTRGGEDSNPPVGVLGLGAAPGEVIQAPTSYYEIAFVGGVHYQAFVMYADADTVALHYSAEDTVVNGYTVHIDNICTDPNLLALYNSLDGGGTGPRYNNTSFNMPYVGLGQAIGTARDNLVRVKIVDTGSTLDPRGCWNLWHWVAPGMSGPCN